MRADSVNGYACDFEVYTGKEGENDTNLGAKVVKKLSQPLIGGNNVFSLVKLLEDLVDDGKIRLWDIPCEQDRHSRGHPRHQSR